MWARPAFRWQVPHAQTTAFRSPWSGRVQSLIDANREGVEWGSAGEEFIGDPRLFVATQVREHRQRNNFHRCPFRRRKISGRVPKTLVRLLQMQRHRIMNPRPDPRLAEMLHQPVAILHPYDK